MRYWSELASAAATYARQNLLHRRRGVVTLSGPDDRPALAVFGNDDYRDDRVHGELRLLRHGLDEAGLEELAFGLTPDQRSWALLVRGDNCLGLRLVRGEFRVEVLRQFLEEVTEEAWRLAWSGGAGLDAALHFLNDGLRQAARVLGVPRGQGRI